MTATELLTGALAHYGIPVVAISENHFTLNNGYTVEVEKNGLYKLFSEGEVVAPFDDVNELCGFILQ